MPTLNLYYSESDARIIARLAAGGKSVSSCVMEVLREKLGESDSRMRVTIEYRYSTEYRENQALLGEGAPYTGKLEFWGGVPPQLLADARIAEGSTFIDLTGTTCVWKNKNGVWVRDPVSFPSFSTTPSLDEIVAAVGSMRRELTAEEKKEKEKNS